MSRLLLALSMALVFTLSTSAAWAQAITAETILVEAPAESRAQIAPKSKAHTALVSLLSSGHLKAEHIAKIVKNPFLSSRIGTVLPNLQKVQSVLGADRLLKQLVKATNENRAVGFSFEAHVAAQFGSQLKEISATVNGHEVDAVLKNGTLVEMKSLPKDAAVSKAMISKATDQLALRGVQGQKLMLVTNRPLTTSLMSIVKKGLGTRVEVKEASKLVSKRVLRLPGAKSGTLARARVRRFAKRSTAGKAGSRTTGRSVKKGGARPVRAR
jgi:hypothetical protein